MDKTTFERAKRASQSLIALKQVVQQGDEADYFESKTLMIDKLKFRQALSEVIQANYMVINDVPLQQHDKNTLSNYLQAMLRVNAEL